MKKHPIVATYYFPNWHVDKFNEQFHGKGWTEWRVLQYATPRFPGHKQPKVPLWGYEDEADPNVMAKKIETASSHGIDAFIFDYYWFSEGPYRERCLLEGFLPAPNCKDIKFALMWANHDPVYMHPCSYLARCRNSSTLFPGTVSPETFLKCTDHIIKTYFTQPNYLRIDGKLYFSIYNPSQMIRDLGGEKTARFLFDDFRARVAAAGLGELILDSRVSAWDGWSWNSADWNADELSDRIRRAGFDMICLYGMGMKDGGFPSIDYADWIEKNKKLAAEINKRIGIPFNPCVSTGWDVSPRSVQSDMYDPIGYPFMTVVVNNTPELFEKAFRHFYRAACEEDSKAKLVYISCWNEWTEGFYLEPCQEYGYARLEAVKRVIGEN